MLTVNQKFLADGISLGFSDEMTLGRYGPAARWEKYSFLKEITQEQMCTYTPEQIATILSQRDDVRSCDPPPGVSKRPFADRETKVTHAIDRERRFSGNKVYNYTRHKFPDDSKPWMPEPALECQYKVCQDCHCLGKDKSWVSLDAVLHGDILPTVATGFSFRHMGFRPFADVEIVKTIGYLPVPLVSALYALLGKSK